MNVGFKGRIAKDIWRANRSRSLPPHLWLRAKALLSIMHATTRLEDLRIQGAPPNVRLQKLRGERRGSWSVTIKLPWCITFKFGNGEFSEVTIENHHRG